MSYFESFLFPMDLSCSQIVSTDCLETSDLEQKSTTVQTWVGLGHAVILAGMYFIFFLTQMEFHHCSLILTLVAPLVCQMKTTQSRIMEGDKGMEGSRERERKNKDDSMG